MKSPKRPKSTSLLIWMGILLCGSLTALASLFIFVLVIKSIHEMTVFKDGYTAPWWVDDQTSGACIDSNSTACKATQICQSWQDSWSTPPWYCRRCSQPKTCSISDDEFNQTILGVIKDLN